MTRSSKLLVAGVALLGLANLWHWQTSGGTPKATSRPTPALPRGDDFRLDAVAPPSVKGATAQRDPFQFRRVSAPPAAVRVRAPAPVAVVSPPSPAVPQKSPEQLAEEAARVDLGKYKLVGIVVRGGVGEAFLVRNEQVFFARRGDVLDGRFAVLAVHAEHVVLRDPSTKVQGTIQVAGK
jgi:hypothetical protein